MKQILIPIANGTEEIEAVTLIDVLRRAKLVVTTASVGSELTIEGANGISIVADRSIENCHVDDFDMILLPGGWGGTDVFSESETLQTMLKTMNEKNKTIGAICAAPYALHTAGVLSDRFTCYPSVEEKIRLNGYESNQKVIEDGNIITSRGPGTAMCLALYLVKKFAGEETYEALRAGLLADFC